MKRRAAKREARRCKHRASGISPARLGLRGGPGESAAIFLTSKFKAIGSRTPLEEGQRRFNIGVNARRWSGASER
jgi:hypothetical protein